MFPEDAKLLTYYFYNDKVAKNETCEECDYSLVDDQIEKTKDKYVTKFKIVSSAEVYLYSKACGITLEATQRAAVDNAINHGIEEILSQTWAGNDIDSDLCPLDPSVVTFTTEPSLDSSNLPRDSFWRHSSCFG